MAPVIRLEIKAVSTREYRIEYLKVWACLLDYPYKIRVILTVRIYSN